jgi:hypothetical protein
MERRHSSDEQFAEDRIVSNILFWRSLMFRRGAIAGEERIACQTLESGYMSRLDCLGLEVRS